MRLIGATLYTGSSESAFRTSRRADSVNDAGSDFARNTNVIGRFSVSA
jgi:hypothetical protein